MQRRAMIALAMTTILWAATGETQTLTGTLKKVADSGTLTVGYRENALPFSYTGSDGKPAGYSIDLCQEIAVAVQQELKLANMAVKWVPVTPENRVDAVVNGTIDIECGSTTASLSRQEKVDFTLMTFVDGASLLIAEGSGLKPSADLGKRIGVAPGTTTEKASPTSCAPVHDRDDRAREGPRRGGSRRSRRPKIEGVPPSAPFIS
jgi:ABC-type amino acid transport substrate-binding protein